MKILLTLIVLMCSYLSAEITITKPLMILENEKGEVVATKSTSIEKAMEKASFLPDGVYTLKRPDVTITVKHKLVTANVPPLEVAGPKQEVYSGQIVWLPCNLSYDPDGTIVKCLYRQTGGPPVEIKYTPEGQAYFIKPKGNVAIVKS